MFGTDHYHHVAPDPGDERAGDRLRFAGGNHVLSVLGSPGVAMAGGMAPVGASAAGPATVQSSSGSTAQLGHVQFAVAGLLILSLAVLIALNKAGFKFSATIG